MFLVKKKKLILLVLVGIVVLVISFGYVQAAYLTTNRDTKVPPDKVTYDIVRVDEYELIYESDTLVYYFREDRDIFAIKDKRTGYTWKTGMDIPFNADIDSKISEATTPEEILEAAIPEEARMNTTYIGISNSLITVEYFESETLKNISSASKDGVESSLVTLNDNPATRRLDINFKNLELKVKVYLTFGEDTITYDIKDEDVTGKGRKDIVALDISPFLGASGGKNKLYNEDTQMYDIEVGKYMNPGYVFVPDGSGSLIRFQDNSASFSAYTGDVYGPDYAQAPYYSSTMTDAIPLKDPVMPVYGIAVGKGQAAFVAYAESGAEYMEIVVKPEENMTYYNWAYPRFVYNVNYFQVYNKKGEGYFTLMEEPNIMDIRMSYTFLAGDGTDGTPAADYTGMALTYREHLIKSGILTEETTGTDTDIPVRLDFIMSDSKKGIVGTDEVVVTTTTDVRNILATLMENDGITNINSGLLGWQKGGETLSKPYKANYSRKVGTKKDFKDLMIDYADLGVDISYARDYISINKVMLNYYGTAARHVNSWYMELDKRWLLPENVPVSDFAYATPKKSIEWFTTQFNRLASDHQSMTVAGLSNTLISTYDSDGIVTTVTDAIALYQNGLKEAAEKLKLNLENPNMYLWKYTDRYLQTPVGSSQYVFETDAVPFLQMVLHGTMEVYAPYSNFSFYTQSDILRMIDYNLSPSFILSKEPSYALASTSSADLYSTEFDQYEELIKNVYTQINDVLGQVIGYTWTGRTVLENGVILNTYHNGTTTRKIIINYTDKNVIYEQNSIAPLSAYVIS